MYPYYMHTGPKITNILDRGPDAKQEITFLRELTLRFPAHCRVASAVVLAIVLTV